MDQTKPAFHGLAELWLRKKKPSTFSPPDTKSCLSLEVERVCQHGCSLPHAGQPPCPGTRSCSRGVHAAVAATSGVTPTPDFLQLAGKTARGLTAAIKGVALGRMQRGRPSLLLISTIWWFSAQRPWLSPEGVASPWAEGMPSPVRSGHSVGAGLAWRSPGPATSPPGGVCSSEAGKDKTTTKLLSFGCRWLRLRSVARGCWWAGAGTPNDSPLPLGVELPFPTPATPSGPCGSPSKATVSVMRVPATGRVVGRAVGLGQRDPCAPADKPPPGCRRHGDILDPRTQSWAGEFMAELRKGQTGCHPTAHSFPGLCNAPFNHQTRIWMQMCPLCNGMSKILCCLQPLLQAVWLSSPHDELECQILITKQIISTLSSRCVMVDSCLTSRFLLLRNPSCNPGLQLYQFCEWLRNDKNPEKLHGVWAHLDPLPWFAGMGGKNWSSKDRMARVILAKLA